MTSGMDCEVNRGLIPLKIYFFTYLAGLACIVPYLPVFGYALGFTAGELGVIYGILPFVGLLSKPLVGIVADKLNAHRLVLLIAVIIQCVFTFLVFFLPAMPVDPPGRAAVHFTCNPDGSWLGLNGSSDLVFCTKGTGNGAGMEYASVQCTFTDYQYAFNILDISPDAPRPLQFVPERNSSFPSSGGSYPVNIIHDKETKRCDGSLQSDNCSAVLCNAAEANKNFVRFTYQFWLFLIVMTIGRVGFTAAYTMGDSVAFDIIGQQKKAVSYGTQRVFGSIGWAVAAVLVGLLMNNFSERSPEASELDYRPAFYGFVVFLSCAIITAWFLRPSVDIHSSQVVRNVFRLFADFEFLVFSAATFFVGMCTGLLYAFLFLYLMELSAAPALMGLSQLAECAGEVPFMFLSQWLIARMGHHGVMVLALGSFCLRYIAYSLLTHYSWWALVLELLHGPGFGLFYANMATFAYAKSPPGGVATMQGVLGGIYDGFGIALGGLIGGTVYGTYGGRAAWRAFGIGSGIVCLLYIGVTLILQRRKRQQRLKDAVVATTNGAVIGDPSIISSSAIDGYETGYATPIPPDTPSEKERLTA
ncbi:hypothetical protein RvY_16146 [Ramazzottius varieornatus]|uniref:Major facilitator superfamily (MFS) profile domain-containing protein n=1 Tax=Ramazzottius varieornatus TaxID=947166 RepID=A0A1D1W3Y6_RAMVA|nr:hypothetical protein RvY_16146 [Ramazzottius varieornatus]